MTKLSTLSALLTALFAASVCAQSTNVTLFGAVDANVARYTASGVASVTRAGSDGLSSTRWGMRGSETLGAGLTASFWLEGAFSPDTGSAGTTNTNNQSTGSTTGLFGRRSTLSLTGAFGELRLGRDLTPASQNAGDFNLFGVNGTGKVGSLFYPTFSSATHIRVSNGVNYLSPVMGGVYTHLAYAFGENSTNSNGRFVAARLGYRKGALHVAGGTARTSDVAGDQTQTMAGATYDFSAVSVNVLYGRNKKGTVDHTAVHVGITLSFGASVLRVGYSDARIKGGDGASQIMIGAIHNLSKRTALYVDGSQIDNKGTGRNFGLNDGFKPLTPGGKSTGYEAGIRHTF